ncbi:MAG: hypothetical protein EB084_14320 [Proteobacteria bacterium]|nr:hypothetical protein [Pseudomonadota bacterium]
MSRRVIALLLALLPCLLVVGGGPAVPWKPRLIVLLAIDTLRSDRVGAYGCARDTTPFLDEMAAGGVVFENAFSQANTTLQSFATVFTGRLQPAFSPHDPAKEAWRLPSEQPLLAGLLAARGYRTVASVAGGHLRSQFGFSRGFERYVERNDFDSFHNTMPIALEMVDEAARGTTPTFLFVHGYDVHNPYHKPLTFDHLFDPSYDGLGETICRLKSPIITDGWYCGYRGRGMVSVNPTRVTAPDAEHIRAVYDGALRYADVRVGELLARIRTQGLERDTLVVVMGDHGEQLLETGHLGHDIGLDDRETHVPLVMWAPGHLPAGRRVSSVVELLDVLPTLLEVVGAEAPREAEGRSLLGLARGAEDGSADRAAIASSARVASLRDARFRYVEALPGATAEPGPPLACGLFSAADPSSQRDLTNVPGNREVVEAFHRRLFRRLEGSPVGTRSGPAGR